MVTVHAADPESRPTLFFTKAEVARIVRRSRPTVARWIKDRTLPARRVGKQWLITRTDLGAFLSVDPESLR